MRTTGLSLDWINRHNSTNKQCFFTPWVPKVYNCTTGSVFNQTRASIIIKKCDEIIVGETNVIYERYLFNNRKQEEGETVDHVVSSLQKLAKSCNSLEDELVRDRLVVGIRDNKTRKLLLQKKKLTLINAIDIC